jgi:hypothetical protein
VLITGFFSCTDTDKKNVSEGAVARAFSQYLYLEDIDGLQPGMAPADSINTVNSAIDNWLIEQLVSETARAQLPEHTMQTIRSKVASYENELYRFAYEKEIVRQKMDTTLLDSTLEEYFNSYITSYLLEEAWLRFIYVRCDKQEFLEEVEAWMSDSIDLYNLEDFCSEELQECHLYPDRWISLRHFGEKIDEVEVDIQNVSSGDAFLKLKDGNIHYLIRILEFRDKGESAPLTFVENDIRSILLNKRKSEFLDQFHRELISSETVKGNVKIFDHGHE